MKMNVIEVMGGLGNQLFQYAFYLSLKKLDPTSRVCIMNQLCLGAHNGYELETVFKDLSLPVVGRIRLFIWRIVKRFFHFVSVYPLYEKDLIYPVSGFGNYFLGVWQRLCYVDLVESELRQTLQFSPFEDDKNRAFSQYLSATDNTVALHIRCGDYHKLQQLYKQLCDTSYYPDAIKYMHDRLDNPVFIVFSDDINWCKEHFAMEENILYVDWNTGVSSFRDMQLMSLCKHAIIANSTFSWWGAWLNSNPDKIVVTPKDWFASSFLENIVDIQYRWVRI